MLVLIKKNQLASEIENQRPSRWAKGDRLDCMITELDKEKRKVILSIKSLEEKEHKLAIKKFGSKDSGGTLSDILGPLLKKNQKSEKQNQKSDFLTKKTAGGQRRDSNNNSCHFCYKL